MPRAGLAEELHLRRLDLSLRLLRIYNYYRVFVGLCLLLLTKQTLFSTRLGNLDPDAFLWVLGAYVLVNLLTVACVSLLPRRVLESQLLNFTLVLADIIAISLLTFLSDGVSSGLAGLLL
ncbi:MAG: hypothetical protein AAF648_05585, partial [Pseudomonadota bacterium]